MRYTREDGCRAWLTYGLMTAGKLQAVLDAFDGDAQRVYDAFVRTRRALSGEADESRSSVLSCFSTPLRADA